MPVAIIPAALAAFQIGKGIVDSNNAKKDQKAALAQIKPYKTPKEVYEVLNATANNAQSGFDPTTLDYLNNQTDQAFAGSIGSAERLGGDPNALSAIFGQKIDAIKGVAANNHQLQMQNFSAYISALNATGANSAAEQKSQQDLLKDQLQKIANDKAIASQQISAGISTGAQGLSNYAIAQLYAQSGATPNYSQTTNSTGYVPPAPLSSDFYKATGASIH